MKTSQAKPRISADSVLLLGQARNECAHDLARTLEGVINANMHRASYFILVHAKRHPLIPKALRTVVTLLSQKPPKMLGTICFAIDNRAGRAKRLWVLPPDIPRPLSLAGRDFALDAAAGAAGLPIIY